MSKSEKYFRLFALQACALFLSVVFAQAQQKDNKQQTPTPTLKRTATKHESHSFNYGGSLTILGAPNGLIIIEAWSKSEVDITADLEMQADTEEDLAKLAAVIGFLVDEELNSMRILTTGPHDKQYMKRYAKGFPKKLMNLPWKIDYRIKVPAQCDLEINTGKGPVTLNNVEGAITLNASESDVNLNLTGGYVRMTIGRGNINFNIPSRGWRGAGVVVQLGTGEINVSLPTIFNAYINADILRIGKIENTHPVLKPERFTKATDKSIQGKAGTGGATLKFTVGDGTLRINELKQ
jgi:hypothetical protein